MDLDTTRFGTVSYDSQDEIHFIGGLIDDPDETRWLLLADQKHSSLYWLQSVRRPDYSLAVFAVSTDIANQGIRLHHSDDLPEWVARTPVVALAPLTKSDGQVQIQLRQPLLIDPRTRQATQATASVDQALQREWSAKVAPLRECA